MMAQDVKKIKVDAGQYQVEGSNEDITIPNETILYVDKVVDVSGDFDFICNYNGITVVIEDLNCVVVPN